MCVPCRIRLLIANHSVGKIFFLSKCKYYSPDAKERVTLNLGLLVLRLMVHVKKLTIILRTCKKIFFNTNELDSIRHHIGQQIANYVQW